MKKIIFLFFLMLIFSHLSFSQNNDMGTGSSGRSIHVAFSPSTSAIIGIHAGLLANSGGILSGNGIVKSGGIYLSGRYNNRDILNLDRISVDLGVSLQMLKFAHIFIGGGYGEYKYPYKEPTILPDKEITGFEIEGGAIINVGKFTLHAGVSTLKFEHLDVFGGIGYTF